MDPAVGADDETDTHLALGWATSSSGFGVAKGSGGSEASQLVTAGGVQHRGKLRVMQRQTPISDVRERLTLKMLALWKFAARVRWLRPDRWPMTRATRRSEHNLRTGMSNSQERCGNEKSRHALNPDLEGQSACQEQAVSM